MTHTHLSQRTPVSIDAAAWHSGYEQGRSYPCSCLLTTYQENLASLPEHKAHRYLSTLRQNIVLTDDICERIADFFADACTQARKTDDLTPADSPLISRTSGNFMFKNRVTDH